MSFLPPKLWRANRISIHLTLVVAIAVAGGLLSLAYSKQEMATQQAIGKQLNLIGRCRMLANRTLLLANAGDGATLRTVEAEFDSILNKTGGTTTTRPLSVNWNALRQAVMQKPGASPPPYLMGLAENTVAAADAEVQTLLDQRELESRRFSQWLPLFAVSGMLLVFGVAWYLRRSVLLPLSELEGVLVRLGEGDFGARARPAGDTEIGRVVQHVARCAELLDQDRQEMNATLAKLEDSELRYRSLWEGIGDAIIVMDHHGIIVATNPAVLAVFGYAPEDLIGEDGTCLEVPGGQPWWKDACKLSWGGKRELWGRHCNSAAIALDVGLSPVLVGGHWYVAVSCMDVSERRRQRQLVEKMAREDALTGLPNRAVAYEWIDARIAEDAHPFALVYVDLDNFKIVNDSLGHDTGDQLLCEAGQRMEKLLMPGELLARIGGDEFMLLLDTRDGTEDLAQRAHMILHTFATPFSLGHHLGYVGVSMGVSRYPEDGRQRADLIRRSDIALYRAKDAGRNQYRCYSEDMQISMQMRQRVDAHLRLALQNTEFRLQYQPQVDLASGRIIGAEALIRWTSKELGAVSPAQFVPVAEETGLIVAIGDWVLETACCDAARWQREAPGQDCCVAINLSARQLTDDALPKRIEACLQRHGLRPELVEFELTETLVMEDPDLAIGVLRAIQGLGCKLSLDDFGTGYSSLGRLRDFPLDCLKIDRSLVDDPTMVRAVVEMAKAFGFKTLAEGVETEAGLDLVQSLGCDIVQGYYYARPMPLQNFMEFLTTFPHCEEVAA